MPWRSETVMDQRIAFVLRVGAQEVSMSAACKEFGISRPTGYVWLRRYQEAGSVTGLEERSRRPHRSPGKTAPEVEETVVSLRRKHGWGARKLQDLLTKQGREMPTATIHRILVRRDLVEQDGSEQQATKRFEKRECNQMVQMDFKGEYQVTDGKCYPLSFLDDHSRYLVGLWPLESTKGKGVYESLKKRFQEAGVPLSVLTDHGTPWFSTTNGHGLTWVSVWMIKQGVRLIFCRIRHPQTKGKVERFHRTLKERTLHRGLPKTLKEWESWAPEFRSEYNEVRPHEALGMKTPSEVYTHDNLRPYQENPPEWEYGGGSVLKLNTQGQLYFRGRYHFVCEALAKERVRVDELDDRLVVTFRQVTIREINLRTAKSVPVLIDRASVLTSEQV
jgi:transposase InsO family protein